MDVQPTGDRVVLKKRERERERKTDSGLYLPQKGDGPPTEGEVVAVGPGRMLDNGDRLPVNVSVGDRVLFKKYSPTKATVDGADLLIVQEKHLMAVVEGD